MSSTAKPPLLAATRGAAGSHSLLPLPKALRQNRSFAHLARLIGITPGKPGADSGTDDDEDEDGDDDVTLSNQGDDDADGQSDIDEESLMWDAQTALIAHQPALAAKYYATAALPPYCSSAACLALGNLLARGSGLAQPEEAHTPISPSETAPSSLHARSPQTSWFASIFRSSSPAVSPGVEKLSPRLITNGWSLPTDGKRAVRDVEGMGKAGGWLILGIGWLIDGEVQRSTSNRIPPRSQAISHSNDVESDEDMIVFDLKGKGRAGSRPFRQSPHQCIPAISNSSSTTEESFDLPTPEDDEDTCRHSWKTIKLLYDLLTPLMHLYRHGHIQYHDPVALPPLAASQLPQVLRPQGDNEKGRNVWSLGSTVAAKVLELDVLKPRPSHSKEISMKRRGVEIISLYIRGITSSPEIAEVSFKAILRGGASGLELPDELMRHALRRLNVIVRSTGGSPISALELDSFRLPPTVRLRNRKKSVTSLLSLADSAVHSSLRLMTPVKSSASLASLSCEASLVEPNSFDQRDAMRSLRDVQRHQTETLQSNRASKTSAPSVGAWWPVLHSWTIPSAPRTSKQPNACSIPTLQDRSVGKVKADPASLRVVASSPQLSTPSTYTTRRLPFEPTQPVATIDPELAALELASALTKHVTCSVCAAGGVNMPNCRKCGLTFCSRKCRVEGAGDGKRHICGTLKSPKLLGIPEASASSGTPLIARPATVTSAKVH